MEEKVTFNRRISSGMLCRVKRKRVVLLFYFEVILLEAIFYSLVVKYLRGVTVKK